VGCCIVPVPVLLHPVCPITMSPDGSIDLASAPQLREAGSAPDLQLTEQLSVCSGGQGSCNNANAEGAGVQ